MPGRKSQSGGDDNGNAVAASAWKLLKISLSHGGKTCAHQTHILPIDWQLLMFGCLDDRTRLAT